MSNRKSLWSDDEKSDDEDEDSETKKDTTAKEAPSLKPANDKPKDKIVDTLFNSEFDSLWDKFPEPDEFKNIYGTAIWERLSATYTELVNQMEIIDKRQEKIQAKRTTCWDTIETKPAEPEPEPEEEPTPTEETPQPKPRGRPPNRLLTPEQLEERRKAEEERKKNPPEEPRVKRKYTKRADKIKMMEAFEKEREENGELAPNNNGYKPRSLRTDAKNTGPRLLQCLHCDKRFESKGQARPHLEVHSGIKPYRCSACDYRSYSKHNVTDAHFTKKHGRKGLLSDVFTDQNDKQNLKALVIMESEQMLRKQEQLEKLDKEQTAQNDVSKGRNEIALAQTSTDQNNDANNNVNEQNNVKKPVEPHPLALKMKEAHERRQQAVDPEAENKSKEWFEKMSRQMYDEGEGQEDNNEDDEDENISKDLLDSLCAESESPIKDDANSDNKGDKQAGIQVKRKRASSYDSSSEFEKTRPKDLDWVPASKKAALEDKINSLEKAKDLFINSATLDSSPNSTAKRKRFSSEAGDLNDQNNDNEWLPAIKPPESQEIMEDNNTKTNYSDNKDTESAQTEISISENKPVEKSEDEVNKDEGKNIANQDNNKDENNNDLDEDAPLKKSSGKGKINDFVKKLPRKELTDPVDIQLAQVTGK